MTIQHTNDHLELSVTDDGCGMPGHLNDNDGMGLRNMRYRARMIGGSLEVGRSTERGTVVRCTFPTPRQEPGGETP